MAEKETFGNYLKNLRLEAGFGLRRFAERVGIDPGNLSRIERGILRPPRDEATFREIAEALGLDPQEAEMKKLMDLSVADVAGQMPADVTRYAQEHRLVPVLLRTVADKRLTDRELEELIDRISKSY